MSENEDMPVPRYSEGEGRVGDGVGGWGRIIGQKRELWGEKIAPVDLFLFSPQLQTQKEADPMESFPTPSLVIKSCPEVQFA